MFVTTNITIIPLKNQLNRKIIVTFGKSFYNDDRATAFNSILACGDAGAYAGQFSAQARALVDGVFLSQLAERYVAHCGAYIL